MMNKFKPGDILVQNKPYGDYTELGTIVKITGYTVLDYNVIELATKCSKRYSRYYQKYIDEAFIKMDNKLIKLFYT